MIKQKGESDCVLACISMLTGLPYTWSDEEFNFAEKNKGYNDVQIRELLTQAGYDNAMHLGVPDGFHLETRSLLWGRRAMLSVPSLNHHRGAHMVYWDGQELFDPSNKQVYRWMEQLHPYSVWIFKERS